MKKPIFILLLFLLSAVQLGAAPRLVIDVGKTAGTVPLDSLQHPVEYIPASDSTAPRLVIDPSRLSFQFSMDSLMQTAEDKMRNLAIQFEGFGDDADLERRLGELIGQILLEREVGLLDLQIQNAMNLNDTVLLQALKLALEELLRRNPEIQEMILREALR